MAPKVNTKLVDTVEGVWTAIGLRANAARRQLDGRGDPARKVADPPYLRPDSDLDNTIRAWGRAMRERMHRRVHGDR